jgi:alpha-beta hydrolase superfamily lysophospholipase
MGGLLAAHAVLRQQDQWAGLILHSAAVDVEWSLVLK